MAKLELVTTPDCNCDMATRFAPYYMSRVEDAAKLFTLNLLDKPMFWGIHWKGEHVLNLLVDGVPSKPVGEPRSR